MALPLKIILILVIGIFLGGDISASENPNIILMMADDMGMGDTSAYQTCTSAYQYRLCHGDAV